MSVRVVFSAVVRVLGVVLLWSQFFKPHFKVVMQTRLVVVDKHACRNMHRVYQDQSFLDAAFAETLINLRRNPQKFPSLLCLEPKFFPVAFHAWWAVGRKSRRAEERYS